MRSTRPGFSRACRHTAATAQKSTAFRQTGLDQRRMRTCGPGCLIGQCTRGLRKIATRFVPGHGHTLPHGTCQKSVPNPSAVSTGGSVDGEAEGLVGALRSQTVLAVFERFVHLNSVQ